MSMRDSASRRCVPVLAFLVFPTLLLAVGNDAGFTTTSDKLWTLNIETGQQNLLSSVSTTFMAGLTFDPLSGNLYVAARDHLYVLNPTNGAIVTALPFGFDMVDTPRGLAADKNGNLLLVHGSTTYSVNRTTGLATALGSNSMTSSESLEFAPNGTLYAIGQVSGVKSLVTLNPTTGALVSVVGALTTNVSALGMDFDSRGILRLASGAQNALYYVSTTNAAMIRYADLPISFGTLAIFRDCNGNGVHDARDIVLGTSLDVDGNGIPDGCPFCGDGSCGTGESPCNCAADCGGILTSETPDSNCADGMDNDCDGERDCDDPDCLFDLTCSPPKPGGPGDILTHGTSTPIRLDGVTGRYLHLFQTGATVIVPFGLAVGPDGMLYVSGLSSRNVARFDLVQGLLRSVFVPSESGGLDSPYAMTFGPDGHLYIADRGPNRVLRYHGTTGAFLGVFVAAGAGGLSEPTDIEFGPDGNLYLVSSNTDRVLRYSGSTGAFIDVFVTANSGGFVIPEAITFGPDGNLYLTDNTNLGGVYRYDGSSGAFIDVFVPNSTLLSFPTDIGFAPNGELYVASGLGNRIQRFDPTTGEYLGGAVHAYAGGGRFVFQPIECNSDGDCDDANAATTDVCYTYACKHPVRTRIYVNDNATGSNSGTSWPNAYTSLQSALSAAAGQDPPSEIWVASGTYRPATSAASRLPTFQLLDGVSLYGGFYGNETTLEERDPEANPTVLSGDLALNDSANFTNFSENAYHVVTGGDSGLDAPSLLDGFVISGGNADGPDFEAGHLDRGGGLSTFVGGPTIVNCVFSGNSGKNGGGAHIEWDSSPTFTNCDFVGNRATSVGGGIAVFGGSEFSVTNSTFSGNTAVTGGGVYSQQAGGTLTNCTFAQNTASSNGGGLANTGTQIAMSNCILWDNSDGGGQDESAQLYNGPWALSYCCIEGWTGGLGGVGNTGSCNPQFMDSDGLDNLAGTKDDNLRPPSSSLVVDSGDDDADTDALLDGTQPLPDQDRDGAGRFAGAAVDRGAFEFAGATRPVAPVGAARGRSFAVAVPGASAVAQVGPISALRLTMFDLQSPVPGNPPCCPPQNFNAYESATCSASGESGGCARWVGPPVTIQEAQASPASGTFLAARLQCTPYYTNWAAIGTLDIFGAEIMPSSRYDLASVSETCIGMESTCTEVSARLRLTTGRHGDVASPFNPPASNSQPDALDVVAMVNKFRNVAGAPSKRLAQLQPNVPELNADVNALDIVTVVDAFRGLAYPYSGPCPCPSAVTCNATPCTSPGQCSGGMCVKVCNGGTNAGQPCINDTHCPGSTCGSGFCRDRCGRCN